MIPTDEELKKIRIAAILNNTLDDYVYLKEDEKGKYIEYAFIEGAPHDNRCLSWYDSYQENAYIRNGWIKDINNKEDKEYLNVIKKNRDKKVNNLFELGDFTCGFEGNIKSNLEEVEKSWKKYHPDEAFIPEDHICRVGCPAKKCRDTHCVNWTYDEPVKCACWTLYDPKIPKYINIPIDKVIELYEKNLLNYETI